MPYKSIYLTLLCSIISLGYFITATAQSANAAKPRIIITADPELDDNNSMIRLLLYSNDLQIEGLIYTSSQFHWKGDGQGTKWFVPGREYDRFNMGVCPCESWRWSDDERFIHDIVDAYTDSYPNLVVHHTGYPTPQELRSKIRYGNIYFDGDYSADTPGSDLIKEKILDDEPGQLYITAWGGHSTIARALKSIQDQYEYTIDWHDIQTKISRKIVLLPSGDQDDTYAKYIKPNWPDIEYRQFTDSPNYGYGAQIRASAENAPYLTAEWMQENVSSKGPLGELYRVWGDGKQMVEGDKVDYFGFSGYTDAQLREMGYFVWMPVQAKGSWLGEGDNHTFMNMLGNGLRAYEQPQFGGWGGHSDPTEEMRNMFGASENENADDMAERLIAMSEADDQASFPDFFATAQRDFASRMHWSTTPIYTAANHEPVIHVHGPLHLMANPGQSIKLHGSAIDPDGQQVSLRWWIMPTGSYSGSVDLTDHKNGQAVVTIPDDVLSGHTIYVILEGTDGGTPALTRYQRVLLTVR